MPPAYHFLELFMQQGYRIEEINVENLDGNASIIDISKQKPQEENYMLAHKKKPIPARESLEEYAEFLKNLSENGSGIDFPCNFIAKGGNWEQLEDIKERLEKEGLPHLKSKGRIYFSNNGLGNGLNEKIEELNLLPLQHRVKLQ